MATITISGNDYFSYATVEDADIYLIPSFNYATWSVLSADQKGSYLVAASRFLDSLCWTDGYKTQAEREATSAIVNAAIEIAAMFSTGETAWIGVNVPSEDIKRLKAGTAEIEYQTRPWFILKSINWPPYLYAMLKDYFCKVSFLDSLGAVSFGTDGEAGPSVYNGDYDLNNV